MVIFCWVSVVLGLQALGALPLMVLLAAFALLLDSAQKGRWGHLVRRSRWLILVLAFTFLLSTPGEAIVPGWPGSWEGFSAAIEHGVRFLLILAAVAWLLASMRADALMAGLYCLSSPLRPLGWRTERAVARLALLLDHIEGGATDKGWRALLGDTERHETRTIELELRQLGRRDFGPGVLAVALLCLAVVA